VDNTTDQSDFIQANYAEDFNQEGKLRPVYVNTKAKPDPTLKQLMDEVCCQGDWFIVSRRSLSVMPLDAACMLWSIINLGASRSCDGWIKCTRRFLSEQTRATRRVQDRIFKRLQKDGFITVRMDRANQSRLVHINIQTIAEKIRAAEAAEEEMKIKEEKARHQTVPGLDTKPYQGSTPNRTELCDSSTPKRTELCDSSTPNRTRARHQTVPTNKDKVKEAEKKKEEEKKKEKQKITAPGGAGTLLGSEEFESGEFDYLELDWPQPESEHISIPDHPIPSRGIPDEVFLEPNQPASIFSSSPPPAPTKPVEVSPELIERQLIACEEFWDDGMDEKTRQIIARRLSQPAPTSPPISPILPSAQGSFQHSTINSLWDLFPDTTHIPFSELISEDRPRGTVGNGKFGEKEDEEDEVPEPKCNIDSKFVDIKGIAGQIRY